MNQVLPVTSLKCLVALLILQEIILRSVMLCLAITLSTYHSSSKVIEESACGTAGN